MIIVLSTAVYFYAGSIFLLAIFSLIIKAFLQKQSQTKIKEYQSEIARSHSQILKLEVQVERLQKQIATNTKDHNTAMKIA